MSKIYSSAELGARGPVTIRRAEAWRVSIPMLEPFRISSGEVSCKVSTLLRLHDGDDWGWGESSAMPGGFYSAETPESCERDLIDNVLPEVVGQTFPTMMALEALLAELTSSGFVRVAIETAAWEILARRSRLSLRAFFGLTDKPVPSGLAVGLYPSVPELLSAIERYRARDYRRLKIKIKRGHDLQFVGAVREALGDFPLFVDANADYSIADLEVFRDLDRFDLMMFEQPLGKSALEQSAELQREVRTPICMDESIETAADVSRAAEIGACKIVNLKLQRVGGLLEGLRIAERAAAHGLPIWMGTMPELGIGSAQALVLATHPACAYPTDVEPSARWYSDDILSPPLLLRDGNLSLPPGPGLGFSIDSERLERYTLDRWTFEP